VTDLYEWWMVTTADCPIAVVGKVRNHPSRKDGSLVYILAFDARVEVVNEDVTSIVSDGVQFQLGYPHPAFIPIADSMGWPKSSRDWFLLLIRPRVEA